MPRSETCSLLQTALDTITDSSPSGAPSSQQSSGTSSRYKVHSLLDKALELEPRNPEIRKTRGMLYFSEKAFELALVDFTQSLSVEDAGSAYRFYLRGLTLGQLDRYSEALADFEKSVKLRPEGDQFYFGLALVQLSLGHPEIALQHIDQARKIAPPYIYWKYVRGFVLTCLNRKDEAIKQFSETVLYTEVGKGNVRREVYLDGSREYERVKNCNRDTLKPLWEPYGRWLLISVYEDYRK